MRILFVNHTSAASGAEFALMRLITGVRRKHHVRGRVPRHRAARGPARRRRRAARADPRLRGEPAPRPGPHAAQPRRGSAVGGVALARAARRFDADILHANTPRAGLMGAIGDPARRPAAGRARARARAAQRASAAECSACWAARPNAIVTVSQEIERRFNAALSRPVATHVYNSFDRERFDPERVKPSRVREELGIAPTLPAARARSPRSRPGRPRTPRSARSRRCTSRASTPTC